jgi:DNA primase large subunit
LRLAFSKRFFYFKKSENQRKWFIEQEALLFESRLKTINSKDYVQILKINGLDISKASKEEINDLKMGIKYLANSTKEEFYPETSDVWKISFTQVLNLITKRKVMIHKGMAYLTNGNLISYIVNQYKEKLNVSMERLFKYFSDFGENERLLPLLTSLGNRSYEKEYEIKNGDKFALSDLETVNLILKIWFLINPFRCAWKISIKN